MSKGIEAELRAALTERAHDVPAHVEERLRGIDYRPRSRALDPRVALATGAGLAATGGAVVAIVGLGAGTSPAFAGWTATPTPPAAEQTASARERCTSQLAGARGAPSSIPPSSIPATGWQPALTDTRGPFTAMILRSAGTSATCFNGPSFTTIAANNTQRDGGASEHALSGSSTAGSGAGSSQSSTSVMGLGGNGAGPIGPATQSHLLTSSGQAYTFVQGQVVSGVTGVTLVRSDGSNVQATVADGSFVAWWPGSAGATSAQIASSAGVATQQLTFTAPPVGPCRPSSSSTSSCTEDSGTARGSAVSPGPEGSRVEK
jgi:hypothetical protein